MLLFEIFECNLYHEQKGIYKSKGGYYLLRKWGYDNSFWFVLAYMYLKATDNLNLK